MKKSLFMLLLFITVYLDGAMAQAIKADKSSPFRKSVLDKNFIFEPQFALPMRGSSIVVTPEYFLKIKKDTIEAFLPYFGTAFAAPLNLTGGGIQFTSTNSEYTVKERKKGWDIVIKPRDAKDISQLRISISKSGNTTVQVSSLTRQGISYTGNIVAGK